MTTSRKLIIFSGSLLVAGLLLMAPILISRVQAQGSLQTVTLLPQTVSPQRLVSTPDTISGIPRRITIPSLGIDTRIDDGYYNQATGEWTISEDAAYFATPTNVVNSDAGNTLIYGHNSDRIFGKLLAIKAGATATVVADNGATFEYIFTSSIAVSPTDVSSLAYNGKPRLTLQTCSGLWNQNRQLIFFDLVNSTRG